MIGRLIPLRGYLEIAGAVVAAGLLAAFLLTRMTLDTRTADRDRWQAQAGLERAAHDQTVTNYRAASAAAQMAAQANVERVQAEQAAINERTVHDYQNRLAAVDARLVSVRASLAARTDLGSPDLAPMSITSEATCRAYGATDCNALLTRLSAAERQAIQLIALQDWVRQQSFVDLSGHD